MRPRSGSAGAAPRPRSGEKALAIGGDEDPDALHVIDGGTLANVADLAGRADLHLVTFAGPTYQQLRSAIHSGAMTACPRTFLLLRDVPGTPLGEIGRAHV